MPVSAYDASGRLKKHALAGTSLAVDPGRAAERKQFGKLHEEATAAAGEGRQFMEDKLKQRFKSFGEPQQARLAEIAAQKKAFEVETRGLQDPEKEAGFARWEKDSAENIAKKQHRWRELDMPEEFLSGAKKKLKGMDWKERRAWASDRDMWQTQKGYDRLGGGEGSYAKAFGGKTSRAKNWEKNWWKKLGGTKARQYYGGKMAKQMYEDQYGPNAAGAYMKDLSDEVDRINAAYIPLREEEGERQQRLADRVEMYNMFLGG